MKKFLFILIIGIVAYALVQKAPESFFLKNYFSPEISTSDQAVWNAFDNNQSDIQLGGSGKVIKILPDDTQGSRHQRFIIELNSAS